MDKAFLNCFFHFTTKYTEVTRCASFEGNGIWGWLITLLKENIIIFPFWCFLSLLFKLTLPCSSSDTSQVSALTKINSQMKLTECQPIKKKTWLKVRFKLHIFFHFIYCLIFFCSFSHQSIFQVSQSVCK